MEKVWRSNFMYHNPILSGFYPDPSIVRVEDNYYLVNSSFEYLPGVPLFHSKDLINWNQIGNVINRSSQIDMKATFCSGGIYAPTIRWHAGTFYMITTCLTKERIQNFLVTTTDIHKDWSDPILLGFGGIDPSLFFEDDRVYAQYASADETGKKCIKQVELDIESGAMIGEESILSYGSGGRDVEGPHIYHINDDYYLLCAEGGTREGHMITVHRSKSILGPYESCPQNPIVTNRDRSDLEIQGTGHGDLVQDVNGNWWMVCLGYRSVKHTHVTGRETMLVPVSWKDGWPVIEDGVVKAEYHIDAVQRPVDDIYDFFDQQNLASYWVMMRDMNVKYECSHGLFLYGNEKTLHDMDTPAFVAIRQPDIVCSFETKLSLTGIQTGEAGISLYMDIDHHMELGVKRTVEGNVAFLRKTVKDLQVISNEIKIDENVILRIQADKMKYTFYVNEEKLGWSYCKHLSTEVADSPFNGVMCGMYVYGDQNYGFYHYFKVTREKRSS